MNIIPMPLKRFMSNPRVAEVVENTVIAVSVETGLKMIGRPTFIMIDKEADSKEKKKFAATKEMLYQGICLTLYLSVMQKFVKPFFYKVFSNGLAKKSVENADRIKEFNDHSELIKNAQEAMKKGAKDIADKAKRKEFKTEALNKIIELKEQIHTNERLHLGKGIKEFGAILGSIIMLTIVAPQISHFIIHPIMKALGFEKGHGDAHTDKTKEQKTEIANA